jgi:hypothetical protein
MKLCRAEGQAVADSAHSTVMMHIMAKLCIMVEDVFAAHQTAIEEGQTRAGHHEHQGGAGEHPGVIGVVWAWVDGVEVGTWARAGKPRRAGTASRMTLELRIFLLLQENVSANENGAPKYPPDCEHLVRFAALTACSGPLTGAKPDRRSGGADTIGHDCVNIEE